jgi:hypothetical protein
METGRRIDGQARKLRRVVMATTNENGGTEIQSSTSAIYTLRVSLTYGMEGRKCKVLAQ